MRVNPEVLRDQGLGDSFEWNRADSSCVRRAGAGGLIGAIVPAAYHLSSHAWKSRLVAPLQEKEERKRYLGRVGKNCYKNQEFELGRIFAGFNKLKPEVLVSVTRNMDRLLRLGGGMPGLGQGPPTDAPAVDTAEQVYISSLALLKMLKHGRAGVPMEVMGLMLGEFVDDYTVRVIDVFAMPQSGTGVSVEAVDPVFQAKMLDMLKQTGRPEMVVGWYHSHPGFGCWLSGVDINTQQSFEALSERAVAVVVDPIQSVKGKVVIDAFRLINANMMVLGHEPRQTTSNLGHLNKPSIQALIHGLNRHYYSITINYRKNELEQKMLLNLHKKSWMEGLTLQDYSEHCKLNESVVKEMLELAKNYNKAVEEEDKMTPEQLAIKNVGKQDPKRHLEEHVDVLMTSNIVQCLAAMLDTVVFK
ncbi:26S proteasome non-ATPase regulatory subunit 14 isoform X1 [Phascolarctos cinereus]|uniref:26S proteasome non-ATPase regulatory subunit 14 n=1 Tax=Phascolarctos cinereus TaxID=38626 RepID=A0A6P5LWT0_PHACI|nr:26S proteasome non-ATPase regulatory subunit 14 isoform X1 [Phascolarctos cinereus]